MVMQRSEMGLGNPIDMIYHIQPWMILTLLPFAFAFEGKMMKIAGSLFSFLIYRIVPEGLDLALTKHVFRYENVHDMLTTIMQVLVGSLMAFFMEVTEYLLVSLTSSLTLSVSGIIKVNMSIIQYPICIVRHFL